MIELNAFPLANETAALYVLIDAEILDHLNRKQQLHTFRENKIIAISDNLRWDERLDAVEDWDLLIRASGVIPVVSVEIPTSIYRRSQVGYRSKLAVSPAKWNESETNVRLKIEKLEFVLTGSEIMSLVGSNRSKAHGSTPIRAVILTRLVFILRPRLLQQPRLYSLFKSLYQPTIKILRIESYV
jgi:hypothetical protein